MNLSVSDLVSILALLVSGYAIWTTGRFNKRQIELVEGQKQLTAQQLRQGEAEAIEAKRADIGANFVKVGNHYRLKIFNRGMASARNVNVEFVDGGDTFIGSDITAKLPMEVLEPHQAIELIAAVHIGTKSKHTLRLLWADGVSETNEKTVYPTL